MNRLQEIATGLDIIEDSTETLGLLFGKHGSFGKFGVFSFNGNKINLYRWCVIVTDDEGIS
jgi:dTDP-4-amino-4,6-dideoxygalactose transaminase